MAITGEDCSQLWSSSAPLPFGPLLWLQLLPTEQPGLLPPGITVHHAVKLGSQNPPQIHPRISPDDNGVWNWMLHKFNIVQLSYYLLIIYRSYSTPKTANLELTIGTKLLGHSFAWSSI